MNQEKKKPAEEYGHDENEWGFKDDSEKIEWEEHYNSRNKKWKKEDDKIWLENVKFVEKYLKTVKVHTVLKNVFSKA